MLYHCLPSYSKLPIYPTYEIQILIQQKISNICSDNETLLMRKSAVDNKTSKIVASNNIKQQRFYVKNTQRVQLKWFSTSYVHAYIKEPKRCRQNM